MNWQQYKYSLALAGMVVGLAVPVVCVYLSSIWDVDGFAYLALFIPVSFALFGFAFGHLVDKFLAPVKAAADKRLTDAPINQLGKPLNKDIPRLFITGQTPVDKDLIFNHVPIFTFLKIRSKVATAERIARRLVFGFCSEGKFSVRL